MKSENFKIYTPPTIKEVSERIAEEGHFRVHFYNWLDDFYEYSEHRLRMIAEQIVPLTDRQQEAFMAASVHQLCLNYDLPVPPWVYEDRYYLPEPWFYPPEISVRPIEFVESPGAFRARNIFTFENVLVRV